MSVRPRLCHLARAGAGRSGRKQARGTAGRRASVTIAVAVAFVVLLVTACSGSDGGRVGGPDRAATNIVLLTHDSFAVPDGLLETFTRETGITVELLQGGDAGTVVNQAILTKGRPQADVLYGVDSTFLTRALKENIFVAHTAAGLDTVDPRFLADLERRVTPIDYGDVCVNYDRRWFDEHQLRIPSSLDALADPSYRGLLVVENPATSSPGLAFLLATIDHFGEDGWKPYWARLRANDVEVASGWEEAYNGSFSGGDAGSGRRPLVVSYASSPPAEVVFSDPPILVPNTGVIESSCYRQVEYAGVLRGTKHAAEAGRLVDFMLSPAFQAEIPLSMFVLPVNRTVALPDVFVRFAARPDDVAELSPGVVEAGRKRWIDAWTDIVLR